MKKKMLKLLSVGVVLSPIAALVACHGAKVIVPEKQTIETSIKNVLNSLKLSNTNNDISKDFNYLWETFWKIESIENTDELRRQYKDFVKKIIPEFSNVDLKGEIKEFNFTNQLEELAKFRYFFGALYVNLLNVKTLEQAEEFGINSLGDLEKVKNTLTTIIFIKDAETYSSNGIKIGTQLDKNVQSLIYALYSKNGPVDLKNEFESVKNEWLAMKAKGTIKESYLKELSKIISYKTFIDFNPQNTFNMNTSQEDLNIIHEIFEAIYNFVSKIKTFEDASSKGFTDLEKVKGITDAVNILRTIKVATAEQNDKAIVISK